MDWVNGYKSYLGFIGYGVCQLLAQLLPEYAPMLVSVAEYVMAPLAGVGLAHKLAKIK